MEHKSVLLAEVLESLALDKGKVIVDGTLGLAGHSLEILKKIGSQGKLIGFDCDQNHLAYAEKRLSDYKNNTVLVNSNFAHLKSELLARDYPDVDGVLLDLGIASPHVDDPSRGFSFREDGPLDMRLDSSLELTAADVVNKYDTDSLTRIFRVYGEERYAPKIARKIVEVRKEQEITTTHQLADLILAIVHKKDRIHPATRVFQALRIEVNQELEVLKEVLGQAIEVLKPGGRLVVISYHSLEDRIVKHFFKDKTKDCICPKILPVCQCDVQPEIKIITKKPIVPGEIEISDNPRSRSAKMRVIEKL